VGKFICHEPGRATSPPTTWRSRHLHACVRITHGARAHGAADFEGRLETLQIMSDRRAMREIRRARAELRAGKLHSFEAVVGRKMRARR
jgi:hypothetical protein